MSIRSRLLKDNPDLFFHKISKSTKLFLFTDELVMRGVITLRDHHTYWGRYYNIPECCIDFYVRLKENGIRNPARFLWKKYKMYKLSGPGYVECLSCIRKRTHARSE